VILVKPGEAVVELQTSEKHFNPMGTTSTCMTLRGNQAQGR